MRWISIHTKIILVFILWVKWLFWLRRWKEVLHVYIHNLELNLIPNQIALYNSLFIIMGIILHDVLQKTIKIFYFSRFKPSSLQFTPTQLLSAAMDSLLGLFDNICTQGYTEPLRTGPRFSRLGSLHSARILNWWNKSICKSVCIICFPDSPIRKSIDCKGRTQQTKIVAKSEIECVCCWSCTVAYSRSWKLVKEFRKWTHCLGM